MEEGVLGGMNGILGWLIFMAILGVPVAIVLRKAGYSPWWVIVAFIPMINMIMLWVFAFSRWPIEERAGATGN